MKPGLPSAPLASELEFRPGEPLQIAFGNDPSRHLDVSIVGGLRDRSLLVTTPQRGGQSVPVADGDGVQVRFYLRGQALGFKSTVLRVCTAPFPYLHLGWPARIEVLRERQSARVRSALAATVRRAVPQSGEPDTPAVVRDLSTLGALLLTPVPVGAPGEALTLQLRLPIEQVGDEPVTLSATIRNAQEESAGGPWRHRYGVGFGVLEPQATILLRAYLYERFADA